MIRKKFIDIGKEIAKRDEPKVRGEHNNQWIRDRACILLIIIEAIIAQKRGGML